MRVLAHPHTMRAHTRGFAMPAIVMALAIAGVVAGVIGSGTVMLARMSRDATFSDGARALVKQAGYRLVAESADIDGDGFPEAPAMDTTGTGLPSGGGKIPATSAAPKGDTWATPLGYCSWDNGSTNVSTGRISGDSAATQNSVVFAVISAGPNKTFETTCAQARTGAPSGDDIVVVYSTAQINQGVGGTIYWGDPVTDYTALNALPAPALHTGEQRMLLSTGQTYRWNGSTWASVNGISYVNSSGQVAVGPGISQGQTLFATFSADKGSAGEAVRIGSGNNDQSISFGGNSAITTTGNAVNMLLNANGQTNQLFLASNGYIGVGTNNPTQTLHINSGTSGISGLRLENLNGSKPANNGSTATTDYTRAIGTDSAGRVFVTNGIASLDSRNVDYSPTDRLPGLYADFRAASANGLADGGAFNGVLTFRAYGAGNDLSGGNPSQLAFTQNGNLWTRMGSDASTWGAWKMLTTSSNTWTTVGNAGTVAGTNFLGTTDAADLVFKTNATEAMRINSSGYLGLGTVAPTAKLHVNSGTPGISGLRLESLDGTKPANAGSTATSANTRAIGTDNLGYVYTTNALGSLDSRSVDYLPSDRPDGLYVDFKQNTTNGLADGGTFNGVLTLRPFGSGTDMSGGFPSQLGFTVNGNLWTRQGTSASAWGTWKKLLDSNSGWTTTGNAGTNATNNFIGTTDAVDFVTRTNNVERLRVSSTGNVGIGTNTPIANLHVQGTGTVANPTTLFVGGASGTGGDSRIVLSQTLGMFQDMTLLVAGTDTRADGLTPNDAYIAAAQALNLTSKGNGSVVNTSIKVGATSASYPYANITFSTAPQNSATVERMRIDGAGNVGIGTNAPDTTLDVVGSSRTGIGAVKTYRNVASVDTGTTTGTLAITLPKSQSSTMLHIKISGYNYTSGTGAWTLQLGGYIFSDNKWYNTSAWVEGYAPFTTVRFTTDATNAYILLGTTATTWTFPAVTISEVNPARTSTTGWGSGWTMAFLAAEPAYSFSQSATTAQAFFQNGNSFGAAAVLGTNDANVLTLRTNGTERIRINTSGNVGIGTTTPLSLLDVQGGAAIGTYAGTIAAPSNGLIVSGKVGFGTTSPQSALDVAGGLALGGYAGVTAAPSGGIITTGYVGINNNAPGQHLDVTGNIRYSGFMDYGQRISSRTYTVNTATPATILDGSGAPLALNKTYLLEAYVEGSSTPTGAKAIVWTDATGTTMNMNLLYEAGKTTNHVQLYLAGGVPSVGLYSHATLYTVRIKVTETSASVRSTGPFDMGLVYQTPTSMGIGTTNPGYKLEVAGAIGATAFTNTSDVRFKRNIANLNTPLAHLLRLHGVSYLWRTEQFPNRGFDDKPQIGFIAQEMEQVLPELVHTAPDGYKSVAYMGVIPLIAEAVKELHASIGPLLPLAAIADKLQLSADLKTLEIHAPVKVVGNLLVAGDVRSDNITTGKLTATEVETGKLKADRVDTGNLHASRVSSGDLQFALVGGAQQDLLDLPAQSSYMIVVQGPDGSFVHATVLNTGGLLQITAKQQNGLDLYAVGNRLRVVNATAQNKLLAANWVRVG